MTKNKSNDLPHDLLKEDVQASRDRLVSGFLQQLAWAIGSILLALVIAGLLMLALGFDPFSAYFNLLRGALSNPDQILWRATPLIFTGLAVALAFKTGLFNIGAEGQLHIGAMVAAVIGAYIALPIVIHPIVAILVAAIAGGLWGLIAGLLKAYRGAHEVVTTIMLNYIAIIITQWLASGPLMDLTPVNPFPQTYPILPTAALPKLLTSNFVHMGFILALLTILAVAYFLNKTVLGFEMRAVGFNPTAAETAGINSKRTLALSLGISGGIAGLAGASEVLGTFGRFVAGFSPGYGFDGITVAVLGNNSPWGVLFGALFLGLLRAGSISMQVTAQVPIEMIGVIQGLIILFVAAPRLIIWLADKGNIYAQWIEADWKKATPIFLTTVMGLIIGFAAFGIGTTQLLLLTSLATQSLILGLPLVASLIAVDLIFIFILGIIGLAAFISLMRGNMWGTILTLVVAIALPIIVIATPLMLSGLGPIFTSLGISPTPFLIQWNNWRIPFGVVGIIGIAVSLASFYLMRWKGVVVGGVI
ncbi:MAG: ABC transporter permease [Promethearchaeota archaeon]